MFFRLCGTEFAVELLLRQRLAGAERRAAADLRRTLFLGLKPFYRLLIRRSLFFLRRIVLALELPPNSLLPQHLCRLFGQKGGGLPGLNIPVFRTCPYLFHSDSPGLVVIRRYNAVLRGNWLMNGTFAPPTLIRPCPDSALLI